MANNTLRLGQHQFTPNRFVAITASQEVCHAPCNLGIESIQRQHLLSQESIAKPLTWLITGSGVSSLSGADSMFSGDLPE